jgi:hypothetical protein
LQDGRETRAWRAAVRRRALARAFGACARAAALAASSAADAASARLRLRAAALARWQDEWRAARRARELSRWLAWRRRRRALAVLGSAWLGRARGWRVDGRGVVALACARRARCAQALGRWASHASGAAADAAWQRRVGALRRSRAGGRRVADALALGWAALVRAAYEARAAVETVGVGRAARRQLAEWHTARRFGAWLGSATARARVRWLEGHVAAACRARRTRAALARWRPRGSAHVRSCATQ